MCLDIELFRNPLRVFSDFTLSLVQSDNLSFEDIELKGILHIVLLSSMTLSHCMTIATVS